MFHRIANIPKSQSFFLFGPRGTGKSTLLKGLFTPEEAVYLDLLEPELPGELINVTQKV